MIPHALNDAANPAIAVLAQILHLTWCFAVAASPALLAVGWSRGGRKGLLLGALAIAGLVAGYGVVALLLAISDRAAASMTRLIVSTQFGVVGLCVAAYAGHRLRKLGAAIPSSDRG